VDRGDEHAAHVENAFRDANERIQDRAAELSATTGPSPYLCECADQQCRQVVRLTADEYGRVRTRSEWFFVVPGHSSRGETVLERTERYELVEKVGRAAAVAREGDSHRR
jgi:hypothetical protein